VFRRPERGRQSLRGADSLRRDDVPPTGRQRVEPADRCSAGGHDGSAGANPAAHPLNDYDDPIADSFSLLQPKDERQVFWCVPYLLYYFLQHLFRWLITQTQRMLQFFSGIIYFSY